MVNNFCFLAGNLQVLTVATKNTEALDRYLRTAKLNNINVKVLGLGQPWTGGDMKGPGGGQKINLLKEELKNGNYKDDDVIMFTDR